jgi:hypothetical protein
MEEVKPTVYFIGDVKFNTTMFPGHEVAHVFAIDHYIWGKDAIRTSSVLNKFPDGSFETMNTIYKPYTDDH